MAVAPPPGFENGSVNKATQRFAQWYLNLMAEVDRRIRAALEPYTLTRTQTLLYVLDAGTTPLLPGDYIESPLDFPFVITGVTVLSRTPGAIVLDISRATYSSYPTFTSIVNGNPPQLTATDVKYTDSTLSGWTTLISGSDILSITVSTNLGALTKVTVALRVKPLGPPQ